MSDLISRSALLEKINSYTYDTVSPEKRRMEHIVRAHFTELIEKQSAAFDLEKVIVELQELKTYKLDLADAMSELINGEKIGTYVCLEDVIELIKRHISDHA